MNNAIPTGLNIDQIKAAAPAAFSTNPSLNLSESYAHVTTANVLDALQKDGWVVTSAKQQNARSFEKTLHTKHSLALWHPGLPEHREGRPQIHLGNSSDGTSAFRAIGGFLRAACLNQLYAGVKVVGGVFYHRGDGLEDRIVAGFRDIRANFGKVIEKVDVWSAIELSPEQQYNFARKAVASRWPTQAPLEINLDDLMRVRRVEDDKPTLWHTYNRVQEGLIRGGFQATFGIYENIGTDLSGSDFVIPEASRTLVGTRERKVRRVTGITATERINTELWDFAEQVAVGGAA